VMFLPLILLHLHTSLVQTAAGEPSSTRYLVETRNSKNTGIPTMEEFAEYQEEDIKQSDGQDHEENHGKMPPMPTKEEFAKYQGENIRQGHEQDHKNHGQNYGKYRYDLSRVPPELKGLISDRKHGQDHRQYQVYDGIEGKNGHSHLKKGRNNNNKNKFDHEVDQSCSSSAECYTDCKLCDGYGQNKQGQKGPVDSFCLCKRGTCKKIAKENLDPNGFRPESNVCIKNGKCLNTDEGWQECNGTCIESGLTCGGQCPQAQCRKGNKCLPLYDNNGEKGKTCNGECIGKTESCDGKCEYDECLMNDGSCLKTKGKSKLLKSENGKSKIWKSCKGKCIKATSKCDGSCSLGQCEKKNGRCTDMIKEENVDRIVYTILKFGICAGQCVKILTNTSTPACHGWCEPIAGIKLQKIDKGICHWKGVGEKLKNEQMAW